MPLYNEADNVVPLYQALCEALDDDPCTFEFIFVDDGSADDTLARLVQLTTRDARVRIVELSRNFGQTAAMAAGIDHARGHKIVTMDGDLQNDPRDIPQLLTVLEDDHDIVAGWRRQRQDEGKRVWVSRIANRIINLVLGVQVRDSGCSLKAYRRDLIQSLPLHGEMHRFIPALSQLAGARIAQVEVRHHPRRFGQSKYGFGRIHKVAFDILSIHFLLRYARRPLTWLLPSIGLCLLLGSVAIAVGFGEAEPTVPWSIAVLLFSMAGFLTIWSLAGFLFAAGEPRVTSFSAIGARPHSNARRKQAGAA
ncbi:glycosyltransferase family 2 protein [Croceicoccus esteveae]|uniref:glycosyltransferase family 2 protein n=1 Tax=Croceicoccus esteveae TaxID=3075597 RepID=UPI003D770F9F